MPGPGPKPDAPPMPSPDPKPDPAPGPPGSSSTPPPKPAPPPAAAAPPPPPKPAPPPKVDLKAPVDSPVLKALQAQLPQAVVEVSFHAGETTVLLKKENLLEVCRFLKEDPNLQMDYLSNLCGVDFPDRPERFEVVYHLFSISLKHRINLKVRTADGDPVPSVTGVWRTANWHEREVLDLLGVSFDGHPDPRRILLTDEWQGHPLRKEYPTKGYDRDHLKLR
jgi:NADH-quinone oxidoreductase subunit C